LSPRRPAAPACRAGRRPAPTPAALLALLVLALLPLPAPAQPLFDLAPDAALPGPGTPDAQARPDGPLRLPLPFADADLDRAYWDVSLRKLPANADSIAVDLTCDDPSALRAITLHLQVGSDWLSAQKSLDAPGDSTLLFQQADFAAESGTPDWRKATVLRLSAWKGAPRNADLVLRAVRAYAHDVAILRATERTAPGETWIAGQAADRAQRLFDKAGIPALLLDDALDALDLRPYRLLVLPYNPALSPKDVAILERFVKRRNGRLAVFYNASAPLAKLLGFALLPYAASPEDWHTVALVQTNAHGLPAAIPHRTRHLIPVRADTPDAANLGRWLNPDGAPDYNLPAAAVSPRGLWFSHLPPLATPSAVQWLLASLAAADPDRRPALDDYLQRAARRDAQARDLLADAPPPPREIRAVWSLPISDRDRHATLALLASNGVNVLYEHLASAGFAHYRGDASLPRSDLGDRRSHYYLSRALDAAHTNNVQLHAWVVCWNLDGLPGDLVGPLRAQGRLMLDADGSPLNWLCPSHPDNQAHLLASLKDLAARELDGIHLDYIRYPARDGCYAPATRDAFERFLRRPVDAWPADVLPGAPLAADYETFRRDEMTRFVAAARDAVRAINPDVAFTAAVYPTPESAALNGQDWPRWLREDLLDFALPMLYAPDAHRFAHMLDLALAGSPSPDRILPGIGTGADEAQLDPLQTARQIRTARQRHTAGVAFFQLDSHLLSRILPHLDLAR
jgi:uncharacterized lipoprotein YddW (UPF0748 family)